MPVMFAFRRSDCLQQNPNEVCSNVYFDSVFLEVKEKWSLLKWREVNKNQFLKLWPKKGTATACNSNSWYPIFNSDTPLKEKTFCLSRHVDVFFRYIVEFFEEIWRWMCWPQLYPFLEFQLNFHDNIKITSSKLSSTFVNCFRSSASSYSIERKNT